MSSTTTKSKQAPSDVLRVLVATDNHLGFLATDPIRGEDSFETMDEILQIGRDRGCDCVFMSGDLVGNIVRIIPHGTNVYDQFHHNKPSRRTMFRTQQVFRKHVFGDGPVSIEVTSDQTSNFGGRIVNFEDPNLSVQLPVFIIHGNHDDPTREGPTEALSAIDILAEAGLVNYFGRADKSDDIHIRPVLIEKGPVKVALYGLGWVRDERLNRTFNEKKVRFTKVQGDDEGKSWYNVMLIHQNRAQKGRGEKNCVAESMIPPFMDFVIWGHEHECEIKPIERSNYYLSQPGSSIAVSLVEGESLSKYVGILEIRSEPSGFASRLIPVLLKSVRPFLSDFSIELSEEKSLRSDMPEADKQDKVMQYLTVKVNELLEGYTEKLRAERKLAEDLDEDVISLAEREALRRKQTPLVRLKVEHTDFPTINLQRFGAQFIHKVANPSEMVLFWKKKRALGGIGRKTGAVDTLDGLNDEEGAYEDAEDVTLESPQDRIQRIAEQVLKDSHQNLELFSDQKLHLAIEEYVVKETTSAIKDFVDEHIEKIQHTLRKERVQSGTRRAVDEKTIQDAVGQVLEKEKRREELESLKAGPRQEREDLARLVAMRASGTKRSHDSEDDEDRMEEEEERSKPKKVVKARAAPAKKKPRTGEQDDDDLDTSDGEEAPPVRKPSVSTKARAETSSTVASRPAAVGRKPIVVQAPSRATTTKSKQAKVVSDEEDDAAALAMISQPKYPSSSAGTGKVTSAGASRKTRF